jgi:hypothetical protein
MGIEPPIREVPSTFKKRIVCLPDIFGIFQITILRFLSVRRSFNALRVTSALYFT